MNDKLISVIMSVRNAELTLEDSIFSILNQSYRNIEFLIMDDASEDKTFEILKKVSGQDKRVKIYRNEVNLGLTKSLNILIKKSKGSYLARQDADDVSLPNRLDRQLFYLINKRNEACTTRAFIKNSQKKIPGLSYYIPINLSIKFKNPFIHGTLMIKREVMYKLGLYNEFFYYSQDYYLFKKLIKNKFKIKNINEVHYVLNTIDNISQNFSTDQNYYAKCVKKNILPSFLY